MRLLQLESLYSVCFDYCKGDISVTAIHLLALVSCASREMLVYCKTGQLIFITTSQGRVTGLWKIILTPSHTTTFKVLLVQAVKA